MDLSKIKNIYLMGIKGVAMSATAILLSKMGKNVWGSDVEDYFQTEDYLEKNNIQILSGFKEDNVTSNIDLMVITGAHNGFDNIEAKRAKELNIPVMTQAEFAGYLMSLFKTKIAVCGSHGKTTTSTLVSYILHSLNLNLSYITGTSNFGDLSGGDFGGLDYFVVEADEYAASPSQSFIARFMYLSPDYILCTNIDFDHPDIYVNIEMIKQTFLKFINKNPNAKLITCIDDPNIKEILKYVDKTRYLTYGFSDEADMKITKMFSKDEKTIFSLEFNGKHFDDFDISIFGKHNVLNSTAAILLFNILGFDINKIKPYLKKFKGARRRFENIYSKNEISLFDDYGHHPCEIENTLKSAKNFFSNKRLVVIFQSHTYSRTYSLKNDFIRSLKEADIVFITDIFPSARENPNDFPIKAKDLVIEAKKMGFNNFVYVSQNDILLSLKNIIRKNDLILTLGAGELYKYHKDIKELIRSFSTDLDIKKNVSLKNYLTFRVDAVAKEFFIAKTYEDLVNAFMYCRKNNKKLHLIGNGSNIVFNSNIVSGLVVLNKYDEQSIISETEKEVIIKISSGSLVQNVVNNTIKNGYSGFESFSGMPGSIGGAVATNAKWPKENKSIGDLVVKADLFDGDLKQVENSYFNFRYGFSEILEKNEIILNVYFKLSKRNIDELVKKSKEIFEYRKNTQPKGFSAGCIFKNPPGYSSGKLIDEAGLKGYVQGDFYVSGIHANFVLNKGNGKIEDLKKLIKHIKETVFNKFSINLEEEIIFK